MINQRTNHAPSRRQFLQTSLATGVALSMVQPGHASSEPKVEKIPLGFDNFSIRAKQWKADKLIRFAGEQQVDVLLLSDLDVYENHNQQYLETLKQLADDAGVRIHAGTGGICPTSDRVIKKWGTPKEHLELGIRIAKTLGSPVFRCYLGGAADRQSEGGIQKHIRSTVEVLKQVEQQAVDAGIKIAVENHAGDMQGRELAKLIEMAGSNFVAATIDSGNATWTLESPAANLEALGPHAVTSGMRDSTVWMTEQGAKVAWNAVGEGQVDWPAYVERFSELCPGVPFVLEIISGFSREIAFKQDKFWEPYQDCRASDFEQFLQMARAGKEVAAGKPGDADFQMQELLRSIRYCKDELGMGLKG